MDQRKKQLLALLSAALVIASAPAISANIPAIAASFPTVSQTFISLFTTIPALFIIAGVFLTSIVEKQLGQKKTILAGLLIVAIFGTLPAWFSQSFALLFLSRCILGLGIGLFNRLIIQMVSALYQDSLTKRARALGLESAFEGLGGIVMTISVGQLVKISWQLSFLVYGISLIGFVLVLFFLPEQKNSAQAPTADLTITAKAAPAVKAKMIQLACLLFVIVGLFIIFNLQITPLLLEKGIGDATQGSNMIAGISIGAFIAGNLFGKTYTILKNYVLPTAAFLAGTFIILTTISTSIPLTILLSGGLGFAFRNIMPFFNHLFTSAGGDSAKFGTTAILIAYNLGSTFSPYFIQGFNFLGVNQPSLLLQVVGIIFIVIAVLTAIFNRKIYLGEV
ncbi:MFS transporter [Enterococcus sp. LJL120]